MNILLVIRWPVGGIRTFIRYVYRGFNPEAYSITIVAPDYPEMTVMLEDLAEFNVRHVKIDEKPSLFKFIRTITKLVFNNNYDIVHSHGFTSGMSAVLPARLRGVRHIITSHDVLNDRQFKVWWGVIKKMGMALMLAMVDTIHSVSYDAHENLCEYFPFLKNNRKCIVIPNGIEVERFIEAIPRNFREEMKLGEDVLLIGFLGRFMSQKGFKYLVEAIDIIVNKGNMAKKPKVLTFGEGGFIREEKAQIQSMGLNDYFCFLPFTSNIAGAIKGLDVVVMPSLWEACGLLAMETLVCGTPLIGTNCIGLREVLRDTPAAIVEPGNGKELAKAIESEMCQSSKVNFELFMGKASSKFNSENTSKRIEQLYLSFMHNNI